MHSNYAEIVTFVQYRKIFFELLQIHIITLSKCPRCKEISYHSHKYSNIFVHKESSNPSDELKIFLLSTITCHLDTHRFELFQLGKKFSLLPLAQILKSFSSFPNIQFAQPKFYCSLKLCNTKYSLDFQTLIFHQVYSSKARNAR